MSDSSGQDSGASASLYFVERGAGPPLLLIHGLMATGEMFEPVVGQFARQHRLIIPDLRGHGRSRNLPPPYTTEQLAADVAGLLDRLGIESAPVLGYSMGGAIAQQFAVDYPKRCARLVLASTCTCNMTTFADRAGGTFASFLVRVLGMRRFAKFVVLAGTKQLSKERSDWLAGLVAGQDHRLMLSALREGVLRFDSRPRLVEIRCATLVVAGSLDRGDVRQAKMLHDGIAGSELVVMDNADHTLIWGHTDEFVRIVGAFLDS